MFVLHIFVIFIFYVNSIFSIGGINELKSLTGNRPYMGYGNPTYEERLRNSQYYVPGNNLYGNNEQYRVEMAQDFTQNFYTSGMFPYSEMTNDPRFMNINQYNRIPQFASYNLINNPFGNRFSRNFGF
uniref:Uncharacterized protein n=1 Tax=Strongyloides venezuelensis TaxID=75913 RepID=A0A0K0EXK9_STRVS